MSSLPSENSPVTSRGFEIKHFGDRDIIVNLSATRTDQIPQLIQAWETGVPQTWQVYTPYATYNGLLYVDSLENPQFIAKRRKGTSPERVKEYLTKRDDSYESEFAVTTNSLTREIRLSSLIKKALATEEASIIATRYGFDDISFVEPLIGIIDHKSSEKYTVYEWIIQNEDDAKKWTENVHNSNASYGFLRRFKELLQKYGIKADDVNVGHFIPTRDEQGHHLRLIDIEAYKKAA